MNSLQGLRYINLEPTSECNLQCRFCSRDKKARPHHFLKRDLFEKLLLELERAGNMEIELRFFLSGEPFLHPTLCEFIKIATTMGFNQTLVHTNGTMIDRYLDEIVSCGLSTISISIDGWEREMYESARCGGSFEKVVANTKALISLHGKRPNIVIQTIVPYGADLESARKKMIGLLPGADDYYVRHPHSWHLSGLISDAAPVDYSEAGTCFPHSFMSIYADGRVPVCCADLNGEYIVGDAKIQSLSYLWNLGLKKFRERIEERLPIPEICDRCERYISRRRVIAV